MLRTRRLAPAAVCFALGVSLAACGDDDDEASPAKPARPAARVTEYVGTVAGVDPEARAKPGDHLVAVVLDGRDAEVYMCDATGNAERFAGKLEGKRLELRSDDKDARLSATLAGSGVRGQVEVGGRTLDFSTTEAKGVGGLYTLRSTDGRTVTAGSEGGNRLEATFSPDTRRLTGTLTSDGRERRIDTTLPRGPVGIRGYDEYRQILLNTGDGRGNPTRRSKPAPNSFLMPVEDV